MAREYVVEQKRSWARRCLALVKLWSMLNTFLKIDAQNCVELPAILALCQDAVTKFWNSARAFENSDL
jgi:hypothetical protein